MTKLKAVLAVAAALFLLMEWRSNSGVKKSARHVSQRV
jgi:hypothetical protein